MRTMTSRLLSVAAVTLALAMPAGLARAQAPVTAPYCGLYWGSGFKTGGTYYSVPGEGVANVRAGRHTCFDRLVVDLTGPNDSYLVSYVPGTPVPLRGGATLDIVVGARAQDAHGQPIYRPANPTELVNVSGWRTFRQVALGEAVDYGGTIAMGVRARLPLRVFVLDGPGSTRRLVIDVAHRW